MRTIYLEPNQVPDHLRQDYNGRKFEASVTDTVTVPASAGTWDGGSRETFAAMELGTGEHRSITDTFSPPWDQNRANRIVTLKPGFAVVRRSCYRGQDMGLRFYVHPSDVNHLAIAGPTEIDATERLVLIGTASYKSHHNGRDRYDMVAADLAWKKEEMPSRAEWDSAIGRLIERKLLRKNKAITPAGRNAVQGERI